MVALPIYWRWLCALVPAWIPKPWKTLSELSAFCSESLAASWLLPGGVRLAACCLWGFGSTRGCLVCVHFCESCPGDSRNKNAPNVSLLAEMLQFVSNQAGDFPDLFSDPLCGTFQGGSSSTTTTSSSSSSSSGTLDPPRPYGQAPLQPFPPPAASPQLQSVPVKAPPQRPAPLLQPRPQLQPQLQQQTVMIAPTFSSAPQTRIIQQPVIYQNTATSFQGRAWGGAVLAARARLWYL